MNEEKSSGENEQKENEELEEQKERVRLVRQAFREAQPNSDEQQMPLDAGTAVASHLAPELGSDPLMKAQGIYDMRRMGISNKRLNTAKIWLSWRGTELGGENRFWRHVVNEDDNRSPSIEGLGRKQAIQMQGATVGGRAPIEEPSRPSFFARHIWNRRGEEEYQRYMRESEERGY